MSRTGAAGGWWLSSVVFAASDAALGWAFHFWYKGTAVPGSSLIRQPLTLQVSGAVPAFNSGFSWDHTNASFRQAVQNKRSSGTFDTAKLTTTLSANTWYAIGGSWDGTNVNAYLNGVKEASTPSAAPPNTGSPNLSVLAAFSGGSQCSNGTIAQVVFWVGNSGTGDRNVPSDAEFAALAQGLPVESRIRNSYFPMWGYHSPEIEATSDGSRVLNMQGTSAAGTDDPPITPQVWPWNALS